MRLFTAIDLPDTILEQLGRFLESLRPHARLRWSRVENLHLTTRFIGEWPESRLEELCNTLAQTPKSGPILITLRGLGWFPNPHVPRVFWVAVEAPATLAQLARDTDAVLERIGLKPEGRPYRPHLTLARIEPGVPLGALRQAIGRMEVPEFGNFEARQFALYLSEPGPGGSRYTKLAEFPIAE